MARTFLLLVVFAIGTSGRGTLATLSRDDNRNKIYTGVRADLDGWTLVHTVFLSLLDLPFFLCGRSRMPTLHHIESFDVK